MNTVQTFEAGSTTKPENGSQLEEPTRKTQLGMRLAEIRARIVASGEPLLSWEEVEREVQQQRGNLFGEPR